MRRKGNGEANHSEAFKVEREDLPPELCPLISAFLGKNPQRCLVGRLKIKVANDVARVLDWMPSMPPIKSRRGTRSCDLLLWFSRASYGRSPFA